MNKTPKISVCIPTHNRGDYLLETINSVLVQIESGAEQFVEICVSDNNSTDETDSIVEKLIASSNVEIRFRKCFENLGADQNYLNVVEMAVGDYCLFLGSDDLLVEGCIKTLLREIESNDGIYLFNRWECDSQMNILYIKKWLKSGVESGVYNFVNQSDFDHYCKQATSIGALFSYISCICFRRDNWNRVNVEQWLIGTAYVHTYILLKMCLEGSSLRYLDKPMVKNRSGNDSFLLNEPLGLAKRIMLDITGYRQIAANLLVKNRDSYNLVLKIIRIERPLIKSALVVRAASDTLHWDNWSNRMVESGYNKFVIYLIGLMKWLARLVLYINRKRKIVNVNIKCFL